jgi:hypothetical protein
VNKKTITDYQLWKSHLDDEEFLMTLRVYNSAPEELWRDRTFEDKFFHTLWERTLCEDDKDTDWRSVGFIKYEDLSQYGELWRWRHYDDNGWNRKRNTRPLKKGVYGWAETIDGKHRIRLLNKAHINFLFKSVYV